MTERECVCVCVLCMLHLWRESVFSYLSFQTAQIGCVHPCSFYLDYLLEGLVNNLHKQSVINM